MSPLTIIDDPEKGTAEHLESIPISPLPRDDKKNTVAVSVIPSTKALVPPKKPQVKISRWLRFKLWFNTYRYAHAVISWA